MDRSQARRRPGGEDRGRPLRRPPPFRTGCSRPTATRCYASTRWRRAGPSPASSPKGETIGQTRAEIDDTGAAQSYFLHTLAARGTADPDLTRQVTEDAQSFHITLKHPTKGTAVIVFQEGMTSTGGEFGFAATGTPQTAPLGTGVQTMTISNQGPSWGP